MGEYPSAPRLGVLSVVRRGESVLLAQRANAPDKGLWGFPGGRVELGETVSEAAARELAEETGVSADFRTTLTTLDVIHRDAAGEIRFHYFLVAMLGDWRAGEPVAGDDALDARWTTAEAAGRLPHCKEVPRLLSMALAHDGTD